jgi:hypothetical protein
VTALYYAVAAAGIVLGSEYRRRIRFIKNTRAQLFVGRPVGSPFPTEHDEKISEIQVLYVVLISSSMLGSVVAWIYASPTLFLLSAYVIGLAGGVIWSLRHVWRCYRAKAPVLEAYHQAG